MANNRVQLTIAGVSITVSTPEEESYVERIAETVDRDMQMLLTETKASVTSAAVLCAVDYMDRYQKANRSATNMRTQIKGYLADAANAKLLYDEEKKRADALAKENTSLKSEAEHLSKAAGAADAERLRTLQNERDALNKQLQAVTERFAAQNEYIAKQDAEIRRIAGEQAARSERAGAEAEQILQLEQSLQKKQGEAERLLQELRTLEEMIGGETADPGIPAAPRPLPQTAPDRPARPSQFETAFDLLPPLYRPDPARDAVYDIDDMPNLNWTDRL